MASFAAKPDIPRNLKPYFLCLIRRGGLWNVTNGHEDLMLRHLAWLRHQTEARQIVFAGPVTDESDLAAVALIETATMEQANAVVAENPGIKSGHFVAEVHHCLLPGLDEVRVEY